MSEETTKIQGRGGPGRGQGRNPLYKRPMARSGFTAPERYMVALSLLGEGSSSAGVRRSLELAAEHEQDAAVALAQGEALVALAIENLPADAAPEQIVKTAVGFAQSVPAVP